jgi:hypothetical protein
MLFVLCLMVFQAFSVFLLSFYVPRNLFSLRKDMEVRANNQLQTRVPVFAENSDSLTI